MTRIKVLRAGLFFLGLALSPSPAAADIEFYFTNSTPNGKVGKLLCTGPFLRSAQVLNPPASFGKPRQHFYTAEANMFSPYGAGWHCSLDYDGNNGVDVEMCLNPPIAVTPSGITFQTLVVDLTFAMVDSRPKLIANSDSICRGPNVAVATNSFDRNPPYIHIYRFSGVAGEIVDLSVSRDGAKGSQGDWISVTMGLVSAGTFLLDKQGPLPIAFSPFKLPQTGSYDITVSVLQSPITRFAGFYNLRVSTTSSEKIVLQPRAW